MMQVVWNLREPAQIHKVVSLANVFSLDDLNKIKQYAATLKEEQPFISFNDQATNPVIEDNIRKCQIKWIEPNEETKWIFQRFVDIIYRVNGQFFNLNLHGLQSLQYTTYDEKDNGFYAEHRDSRGHSENGLVRKLSFSLQLTDPSEYEGGELIIDGSFNPSVAPKELGAINFFVSDMLHEAKPVTKGLRHVLVGWVVGPPLV